MKEQIDARLAELRELLEQARSMPMSASVMVNRAEVLDVVAALEKAIGETLSEAHQVLGERDAVVARGQEEADAIVRRAEAERDKLVSDTDVYRLGSERAADVEAVARRDAEALRQETEEYVESHLANFEHTLERTLEVVRRGRARLTGGHSHGLADDSDVADINLPEYLEP